MRTFSFSSLNQEVYSDMLSLLVIFILYFDEKQFTIVINDDPPIITNETLLYGEYTITIRTSDDYGIYSDREFTMAVYPPWPAIISWFLLDGEVGLSFNKQIYFDCGVAPFTWSVIEGDDALPDGLELTYNPNDNFV